MKKLACVLLTILFSASIVFNAGAENTFYMGQEGEITYNARIFDPSIRSLSTFTAKGLVFDDLDEIASRFFADKVFSLSATYDEAREYTTGDDSLSIYMDGRIFYDSEFATTIFTPITFTADATDLQQRLHRSELAFMNREEAEAEAERFLSRLYNSEFMAVDTFSISREDYNTLYESRRNEIEANIAADHVFSKGYRAWKAFEGQDLAYLIQLAQVCKGVPIQWESYSNLAGFKSAYAPQVWLLLGPEGVMFLYTPVAPVELLSEGEIQAIISCKTAIKAFSEGYNYILGAEPIEITSISLVWFKRGIDLDRNTEFVPAWCFRVPIVLSEERALGGGYFVDARTGEAML